MTRHHDTSASCWDGALRQVSFLTQAANSHEIASGLQPKQRFFHVRFIAAFVDVITLESPRSSLES